MTDRPCPVCDSRDTELFLERLGVPVHQNVPYESRAEARAAPVGDLRLMVCDRCGFVWNAAFDSTFVGYDAAYDNSQRHSPLFDAHMRKMGRRVLNAGRNGSKPPLKIVEIGCGKGDFLRLLTDYDDNAVGIGFDTTYAGPTTECGGRLRFERRLFDRSTVEVEPDIVVCRHVIEHIPDPMGLLRELNAALAGRRVSLFFETPDVSWILENRVIWDFFHEHCSLFNPESLATAFGSAGFEVVGVDRVFGEQYLWIEARSAGGEKVHPPTSAPDATGTEVSAAARAFSAAEHSLVEQWRQKLARLREKGPVALWGAGAKGVTLANLCDPDTALIDCIVDINPAKQGRFVAGAGHPIVSPAALRDRGVASVVLMNPNYEAEIRAELRELSAGCDLVLS